MFTRFLRLATAKKPAIQRAIDSTWNTGTAKVLDNAIVGYMIAREVGAKTGVDRVETATDTD